MCIDDDDQDGSDDDESDVDVQLNDNEGPQSELMHLLTEQQKAGRFVVL